MGILIYRPNKKDLNTLASLCLKGDLEPIIDRVYPLPEVPEALRYLGEGKVKGKIIIKM